MTKTVVAMVFFRKVARKITIDDEGRLLSLVIVIVDFFFLIFNFYLQCIYFFFFFLFQQSIVSRVKIFAKKTNGHK